MNDKIYQAFDSVRAEDALKKNVRAFLSEQMRKETRPSRFRRFAPVLVCLALLVSGFGGWRLYFTSVSSISVDVNPSIELGINRFDRVVSVVGYNEDGVKVSSAVKLKNLQYTDALVTLLNSEAMAPYLNEDALVFVTINGNSDTKNEEMLSRISTCRYAGHPRVECRCGNREELDAAHAAGLSFGKYCVFLELQELDPSVTVEEVSGWTMRQLRDRISELSGGSDAPCGPKGRRRNGNH